MSNVKNLVSLNDLPPEKAREIRRKGAYARAEAARRKRDRREWAKIIGAAPVKLKMPDGSSLEGADLDAALVVGLYRRAQNGDARAARLLLELHGDLEQRVSIDGPAPIICATQAEADATYKAIAERAARRQGKAAEGPKED